MKFFRSVALAFTIALSAKSFAQTSLTFSPRSMAYVLQADSLRDGRAQAVVALQRCGRDLIVLDSAYAAAETGGEWTQAEITTIRSGKAGRKVLAYLSIGEAENYRRYWNPQWDSNNDGNPDPGAPTFLLGENPDWPGNYKVKYWDNEWQQIILGQIDVILAQGFDGLYLDLVDAFEFFEESNGQWIDNRINPETGNSYRKDMINWVTRLAQYCRQKKEYLIVPQNGAQLLEDSAYAELINGIGIEDLFTDGNQPQTAEDVSYGLGFLKKFQALQKPVLLIEYPTRPRIMQYVVRQARKQHMLVLITDRDLKTLGHSFPPR